MSPEQRIRIRTRVILGELGYPIFNFMPSEEANFPMLNVGEQFKQNERIHVDKMNGRTQITIHVWHDNLREEGTLMNIMNLVEEALRKEFKLNVEDVNTEVLIDDTVSKDINRRLLHGVVETNIKF